MSSTLFVFFAIFEYAIANWLMRIEARVEKALKKASAEAAASSTTADATQVKIEAGHRDHDEEKGKGARASIIKHLSGVDRWMVSSSGRIILRDQHLDIACRYLYPIAYTIVLAEFLSHEDDENHIEDYSQGPS